MGEIVWCSGKREEGVAGVRKSLAENEALLAEEANVVVVRAGAQGARTWR